MNEKRRQITEQYDRVLKPVTEEVTREEIWIPALDGARMRTILFRPAGMTGPFSVIVIRTCYPMQEALLEIQGEELARRGFALLYQWCRGIAGSEGVWEPYKYEREDGIALMNYLQKEYWVKNIGLIGASYLALTGWFIADLIPDKVKTMYLTVLGTEWHTETWQEGAFRQDIFTSWIMGMAANGNNLDVDYMTSAKYRPQIQVDEDLWHCHLDVYRNMISRAESSDPYWTEGMWGTLQQIPPKTQIPIFIGEGWYDIHLGNALKTYEKLSPEALKHSVLQVNPGNHGLNPVIPGQKKQEHAAISEFEQQIRWFYDILVKEELPHPGMYYYMIGADEWRTYETYPITDVTEKAFYLNQSTLIDTAENMEDSSCRSYVYDPNDPVISHGGGTLFRTAEGVGSLLQPEPNWRPDVLSYCSDPLTEDLDLVGEIKAELWVQSDAPDTCFTIKLIEEQEDHTAYNIRNGITTLCMRNGTPKRLSYDGNPVKVTITCWDIAYRIQKGARIRLDISSSNFPEFSVHPNTDQVWSLASECRIAHQKILTGKEYPSRILLPVEPSRKKED